MALYKAQGIVLKTIKLGEADRIITILTGSRGKVRAVAKGVRKTKSKFGARLEPFSHVDALFYAGRGSLDTITQAELIRPYGEIREDLHRVHFGAGMLDIAEKASVEGDSDPQLFALLERSLEVLASADRNHRLLLAAFDLKLMAITGFRPRLDACALCGESPSLMRRLSNERGGAICERCFDDYGTGTPLRAQALALLDRLLGATMADVADFDAPEVDQEEAARAIGEYVAYHLQSRLRSRECLDGIIGKPEHPV